jgi:hypothetical protein
MQVLLAGMRFAKKVGIILIYILHLFFYIQERESISKSLKIKSENLARKKVGMGKKCD